MKGAQAQDNCHCPRYVGYAGVDDSVEASDDLEELIAILQELVDPAIPEDVAIWEDGCRLVAVVLEDGRVIRYQRRHKPLPDKHARARYLNGAVRRTTP